MPTFTKGKWTCGYTEEQDRHGIYKQWRVRSEEHNRHICDIFIVTDEGEANAHLIAASPVLYEALEHLNAMADDAYFQGHPEWAEIVKQVQAAISLAHGKE